MEGTQLEMGFIFYLCPMPSSIFMRRLAFVLSVTVLLLPGCKDAAASARQGKWLSYSEKSQLAEQQLRAKWKVERRNGESNSLSDSGEVWFPSEVIQYNAYGQEVVRQDFDEAGKVVKETRNVYRDSLLLRTDVKEANGYSSAIEYTYNAKQQRIAELLFQRGDSTMRRTYTLDPAGNETEVALVRFRDSTRLKLLTERDRHGGPSKVSELQDGKANWNETYSLGDTLWRIQRTDGQGKLQNDYEMHFDRNGAIRRMVNRNEEGIVRMEIAYVNNAQGRPVKETHFGTGGRVLQTIEYAYDERGLLSERKLSTPTVAFVLTTRYTYTCRK